MSIINPDWELKETINAIRRWVTKPVTQYNINHLRIELEFAIEQLDYIESKKNDQNSKSP